MQAVTKPLTKARIQSIDILRGAIMIIMAIDHVRDYCQLGHPDATILATTTPFLFFSRWITHFCAPVFVFLSGVSAYLAGTRRTKAQLSSFLIKRGVWLLFIEFVVINFEMNLDVGFHMFVFQVIWAIGGSMIILGLLIWTPLWVIALIGGIIFFGHNLLDIVTIDTTTHPILWKLLLTANGFGSIVPIGHDRDLLLAYALLPWTGVMLLGYVFGSLYKSTVNPLKRRKILLLSGLLLLALFFVLRGFNLYGDPSPWAVQKTTTLSIISFFNVSKYPCSLLYLCMTLGPALIILSATEQISNKFTAILVVYGNVPLFYYLCHWALIRVVNLITFPLQGFKISDAFRMFDPPANYGFSLGWVYLIWAVIIVILYFPCRWYSQYKKTHTQWWLSYL